MILANAITNRSIKSLSFNRVTIIILLYTFVLGATNLYVIPLTSGIGVYGGLFHITAITQTFVVFITFLAILIMLLTGFHHTRIFTALKIRNSYETSRSLVWYDHIGSQIRIIEYPVQQSGKLLSLRVKLPNSGDALKLLIPNLVEFFHGGWTNYSGMVISHKIFEREMGNRGSKSSINKSVLVKEQRVDGSYIGWINHPLLRYTLRGFERITWPGIPSNQIISKQFYSTAKVSKNSQHQLSINNEDSFNLNPWFVTGFVDGDGSFSVSIAKKKSGIGWKIQPIFTIGLDPKDLDLLVQIKVFFKIGKIYTSKRGIVYYTVGSTKDIIKYILPHFDKYPLISLKLKDYLVFREITLLIEKGEHNYLPGLLKIFSLRAILNKGLPDIIKTEYPDIIPANVPEFNLSPNLNPYWLSGFITAEGCFFISIYSSEDRKVEFAISLVFSLSQHIKDIKLLERFVEYLSCGTVRKSNTRETAEWIITKSKDVNEKLIPFLTQYTLSGVKLLDFERFKKASLLIENKMHLTSEGVVLIKAIKDAMYNR